MKKVNDIQHGKYCVFVLYVHLVFVIKYRPDIFTKEIFEDMKPVFASVCANFEAELIEFDGVKDHVHLLVNAPPKPAISGLQTDQEAYPNLQRTL